MEFKGKLTKGSAKEFKSPGEGTHIMGLVSIKDCIKKFQGTEVPGVQFLFKSVTDPDATVCHRVSNSLNPKSSLSKTLRRMAPKIFTEKTSEGEAFALLGTLENNWFEVSVIETQGQEEKIWVNVDDCLIRPANPSVCPAEKPIEYFAKNKTLKPPAKIEEVKVEPEEDNIPF